MLKNLINWVVLTPNFIATPVLSNVQNMVGHNVDSKSTLPNFISKKIIISNTDESLKSRSSSEDKSFWGPNSDTNYRIYIDNSGDEYLPPLEEKTNDYIVGTGKKGSWYNHLINGLSIKVTDFAESKESFLEKYKTITFSYFYFFNFWNSKMGWTYGEGKYESMRVDTSTFNLTPNDIARTIYEESDPNHDNNESAKLTVKQEWNGNLLTFNFYLSVSYYWKALSPFKHASLAQFNGDHYSFTPTPEVEKNKAVKIRKIQTNSKFIIDSSPQEISFIDFDKEIKSQSQKPNIAESTFKTTTIFIQGYRGAQKIGNTIYTFAICLTWKVLIDDDSSLLLNGNNLERRMTTGYKDGELYFIYQNSLGNNTNLKISIEEEEMLGMEMDGSFHLPFIYV